MSPLTGPFLAACALLVLAGGGKVRDPAPLVRALRSLHLPGGPRAVRALAAVEVVVGLAGLAGSRPAALAVAASYLVFTAVVVRGLRRGGVLASCGCFGRADTPPTRTHAVVTAALAGCALAVAGSPLREVPGPALLAAAAAVAVTAYLVLAVLPLLSASVRQAA